MSYTHPRFDAVSFDAGGRLRTGQITTLGDLKTLNADNPLYWQNVGTGAASAWADNKYNLSVTAGQYQIRQSRQHFPYFSGKSQQVEITCDGFGTEAGVTKRVGYFTSNLVAPYASDLDGFWIEDDGTKKELVVSRKGTEVLRKVSTQWSGASYLSGYDWDNFTVLLFDFLWLGGATLRVFAKIGGAFVLLHQFDYAGTAKNTFTYSPHQRVRAEVRGDSDAGSLRLICAQVGTEGSVEESGTQRAIDTGHVAFTLAAIGTSYPIIGIRKKSTHLDSIVKQIGVAGFVGTSDKLLIELHRNPTLSGALAWSDVTNSAVQQGIANGSQTVSSPGEEIFSLGIVEGSSLPPNLLERDFLSSLGSTIDGTSDTLVLCGTPITATVGVHGFIGYKEY